MRSFMEDDLPQVAALYERVLLGNATLGSQALRSYLEEIFCRSPWRDEALPSLVYEAEGGKVVGCLGVMPRRMSMNGRPVRVAVSHNFMVEPGSRSTLAAVQMVKTYAAGPQDLSIAEGSNVSRRIWERFGGTTALLYSIRWTRPLRPGQYVLSFMRKRGVPAPVALGLRALCPVADAIAARLPQSPFRLTVPGVSGEELHADTLLACLAEFSSTRSLWPEYDERSLKWLLELLAQKRRFGTLRKVVVRNPAREVVGWYLYYAKPGGIGEVVQIGARHGSIDAVLDHLFYDAWRHGAIAVSGQLDPEFMHVFSERYCLFRRDASSARLLVHSKHPDLLQAILHGDAFLTRLEGEWWIGFGYRDA